MDEVDLSGLSLNDLLAREWLTANGIGGYAASTLPGLNTRKYHGLLVAAMAPPIRQMVLLSRVEETVLARDRACSLDSNEYPGIVFPQGHRSLRAFSPVPFPRWAFQADGWTLEKSLQLLPGHNTVCLTYTMLGNCESAVLELRPLFALRGIHELMYQWNGRLAVETRKGDTASASASTPGGMLHRILPTGRTPECFFSHDGAFKPEPNWYLNTIYRCEQDRGYGGLEDVWTPGSIRWTLKPGQTVHFICSSEPFELGKVVEQLRSQALSAGVPAVAFRADEEKIGLFVKEKSGKERNAPVPDTALKRLVRAAGEFVLADVQTPGSAIPGIIAGYPWTVINGRDALIALPGLLLVTGRLDAAKSVLQRFISSLEGGLMPSAWPIDGSSPRYAGADVSLWFINAVHAFLRYGGSGAAFKQTLTDAVDRILRHYQHGAGLGIVVDNDGLLASRQPSMPTTWMDAKIGDWVITPRQGRPVELNALWYNALRIGADLVQQAGRSSRSQELLSLAARAESAFNQRFWNESARCCHDVIDDHGADRSIRPNQILAISLAYPVLALDRHLGVLQRIQNELLTPVGLRTLSADDSAYEGRYAGSIVSRDRAYHQGSVYPWLLGPFISAYPRVHGRSAARRAQAGQMLEGCLRHLAGLGVGQLCELFDGDAPHHPGGLTASARSVGELLRCYAEDVLDLAPAGETRNHTAGSSPVIYPSRLPNPQ